MSVRFQLEGQTEIHDSGACEPQLNLLAHAQLIELDIGSQCGGHGLCAGDRVCVSPQDVEKLSPLTEIEREHFTAEEIARGLRLACQCFPVSGADLVLRVDASKAD